MFFKNIFYPLEKCRSCYCSIDYCEFVDSGFIGIIAGTTIGGLVLVALIVTAVVCIIRRVRRTRQSNRERPTTQEASINITQFNNNNTSDHTSSEGDPSVIDLTVFAGIDVLPLVLANLANLDPRPGVGDPTTFVRSSGNWPRMFMPNKQGIFDTFVSGLCFVTKTPTCFNLCPATTTSARK
ncbi:uncharacterized protein LOC131942563 [Physella acuta]|uniref:uncharacterized protein LOC131942563 n=1 Tax=Physella acuta TaxID=109671 RepID=UPI0027DAFFC4|nr:uncharacterized protein LOC131942563 [Physella acuta]